MLFGEVHLWAFFSYRVPLDRDSLLKLKRSVPILQVVPFDAIHVPMDAHPSRHNNREHRAQW